MQTIAIMSPILAIISVALMILTFTKLGKINVYTYFIGAVSLITSFAYFLRGIFKIGQYVPDLIYNWTAFLLWLAVAVIFFIAGLPIKSPK